MHHDIQSNEDKPIMSDELNSMESSDVSLAVSNVVEPVSIYMER